MLKNIGVVLGAYGIVMFALAVLLTATYLQSKGIAETIVLIVWGAFWAGIVGIGVMGVFPDRKNSMTH